MLVESRGLHRDLTCVLKAETGKLDIKRRHLGILFFQFTCWFTLKTNDYDVNIDFCVVSTSRKTSLKIGNIMMTC